MAELHKDCKWKLADDGNPENPLQSLTTSIARSSRDFSEDKFNAYLYSICVGWGDDAYKELQAKFGWSDETVKYQKLLHQNYIKAWNLLTDNDIK